VYTTQAVFAKVVQVTGNNSPTTVVELRGVTKQYVEGGRRRTVLAATDLTVRRGELAVLVGKSGSGKSTLLNLISGIDVCDSGTLRIDGRELGQMSERERTLFRRQQIGFVFQFFNLIPTLTVAENVQLPLALNGQRGAAATAAVLQMLDAVGLADRAAAYPDRLSGGEQQRVAIARALVHNPALVLADEPTGNLDEETGQRVLELLDRLTRQAGRTMVMVTHSRDVVGYADQVWALREGHLTAL
jgi:putative ABC transport system ATP-binding protein